MSLKRLLNKRRNLIRVGKFLLEVAKFWFGNRCPQTDEDLSKEVSESVQAARRESPEGGI